MGDLELRDVSEVQSAEHGDRLDVGVREREGSKMISMFWLARGCYLSRKVENAGEEWL